jgi:DNA-binding NarL/FixJ family response regulator
MAAQSSGRPLNALVVESDPDYAVSVRAIAGAASLGVTVTPEPKEGLRLLASERFDLVVLAVREQDDVAALVGEIHDTSPSGVVILDEALGIAREAYDSGADQVLPKPFVPGHLAGAIRAALRTRGPESIVAVASTIRVGDVEFNSDRREVRWDDHFRNRFFTAQELRDLAWDDDQLGLDQVRGYIYRLGESSKPTHCPAGLSPAAVLATACGSHLRRLTRPSTHHRPRNCGDEWRPRRWRPRRERRKRAPEARLAERRSFRGDVTRCIAARSDGGAPIALREEVRLKIVAPEARG